ncbi:MAG TPA: addiction module protein [Tepidisphaeraceae bacterium]|jgi:hypothetical protein|nr:addiction module protein [Tepidisphaeraceae bacterium]
MTKLEEAISQAAREMSRDARAELCHLLMQDLDDAEQKAIDDSWAREINRRIKEIDAGEPLLDGDEVMRQARARIAK